MIANWPPRRPAAVVHGADRAGVVPIPLRGRALRLAAIAFLLNFNTRRVTATGMPSSTNSCTIRTTGTASLEIISNQNSIAHDTFKASSTVSTASVTKSAPGNRRNTWLSRPGASRAVNTQTRYRTVRCEICTRTELTLNWLVQSGTAGRGTASKASDSRRPGQSKRQPNCWPANLPDTPPRAVNRRHQDLVVMTRCHQQHRIAGQRLSAAHALAVFLGRYGVSTS